MKKILVLTVKDDVHTKKIGKILKTKYDKELLELNREDYGVSWTITIISNKSGPKVYVTYMGDELSEREIGSIWLRRNFHFASNQDNLSPEEAYISSQTAIHVNSAIRLLAESVFCINTPEANWKANSKCLQAHYAASSGFLIPETFQGGSPFLLNEFSDVIVPNAELCIKPIESTHLRVDEQTTLAHYTKIFKRRPLNELDSIKVCPVTIQRYIEKDYEIRATVVERKIFAASIDTKNASSDAKIDFRHYDWANTPYFAISLPNEVEEKIFSVMSKMGLSYGAFDLIKTIDGDYYFLEVNAQGQWLWIEDMTGLNISESIADSLWMHT